MESLFTCSSLSVCVLAQIYLIFSPFECEIYFPIRKILITHGIFGSFAALEKNNLNVSHPLKICGTYIQQAKTQRKDLVVFFVTFRFIPFFDCFCSHSLFVCWCYCFCCCYNHHYFPALNLLFHGTHLFIYKLSEPRHSLSNTVS